MNGVLVQLPLVTGVGPRRTWTAPDVAGDVVATVVGGEPAGADDVVGDDPTVVDVGMVPFVVGVEEPLGTGRV